MVQHEENSIFVCLYQMKIAVDVDLPLGSHGARGRHCCDPRRLDVPVFCNGVNIAGHSSKKDYKKK